MDRDDLTAAEKAELAVKLHVNAIINLLRELPSERGYDIGVDSIKRLAIELGPIQKFAMNDGKG